MIHSVRAWFRSPSLRKRRQTALTRATESLETRLVLTAPSLLNITDPLTYITIPGPDEASLIDTDATVSDAEGNYAGGHLKFKLGSAEKTDRIGVLVENGQGIHANKKELGFNGVTIATWGGKFVKGEKEIVINFNENITHQGLEALIHSLAYINTNKNPGDSAKAFSFELIDGAGETSGPQLKALLIEARFDGNYAGKFSGTANVSGTGTPFDGPVNVPGTLITSDVTALAMSIEGVSIKASLPNAPGAPEITGTLTGTHFECDLNVEVVKEVAGFEIVAQVQLHFTGDFELDARGKATGHGTWTVTGDLLNEGFVIGAINGSGEWEVKSTKPPKNSD